MDSLVPFEPAVDAEGEFAEDVFRYQECFWTVRRGKLATMHNPLFLGHFDKSTSDVTDKTVDGMFAVLYPADNAMWVVSATRKMPTVATFDPNHYSARMEDDVYLMMRAPDSEAYDFFMDLSDAAGYEGTAGYLATFATSAPRKKMRNFNTIKPGLVVQIGWRPKNKVLSSEEEEGLTSVGDIIDIEWDVLDPGIMLESAEMRLDADLFPKLKRYPLGWTSTDRLVPQVLYMENAFIAERWKKMEFVVKSFRNQVVAMLRLHDPKTVQGLVEAPLSLLMLAAMHPPLQMLLNHPEHLVKLQYIPTKVAVVRDGAIDERGIPCRFHACDETLFGKTETDRVYHAVDEECSFFVAPFLQRIDDCGCAH
jgi:hypothetical protein